MSERALQSVKFALLGASVGTVTALAGDKIYETLLPMMAPSGTATTQIDFIGRSALALVTSSAMTALALYGGDQLMMSLGGENDPLAGTLFYHVCLGKMATAEITPNVIRNLVNSMWNRTRSGTKPSAPSHPIGYGPTPQPQPIHSGTGYGPTPVPQPGHSGISYGPTPVPQPIHGGMGYGPTPQPQPIHGIGYGPTPQPSHKGNYAPTPTPHPIHPSYGPTPTPGKSSCKKGCGALEL